MCRLWVYNAENFSGALGTSPHKWLNRRNKKKKKIGHPNQHDFSAGLFCESVCWPLRFFFLFGVHALSKSRHCSKGGGRGGQSDTCQDLLMDFGIEDSPSNSDNLPLTSKSAKQASV